MRLQPRLLWPAGPPDEGAGAGAAGRRLTRGRREGASGYAGGRRVSDLGDEKCRLHPSERCRLMGLA